MYGQSPSCGQGCVDHDQAKAAISWSGGKDCCLALLRVEDDADIVAMVTMFDEDGERTINRGSGCR